MRRTERGGALGRCGLDVDRRGVTVEALIQQQHADLQVALLGGDEQGPESELVAGLRLSPWSHPAGSSAGSAPAAGGGVGGGLHGGLTELQQHPNGLGPALDRRQQ